MFVAWYLAEAGDPERAALVVDAMPAATHNLAAVTGHVRRGARTRGDPTAGVELLKHARRETRRRNLLML